MNKNCVLCDCELTKENNSKEHVIPNAIGGRKKVKNFLCIPCNNKCGDKWDKALSEQLSIFSLFFNISRERGAVQPKVLQNSNGKSIIFYPDGSKSIGKPDCDKDIIGETLRYTMFARDIKEAKKMNNGFLKRHNNKKVKTQATYIRYIPNDPVHITLDFGGADSGRSIVKSALALVVDSGIDIHFCEEALNYLTNDEAEPSFGFYYSVDVVLNRIEGMPFHCVYIKGDPKSGLLLGYVELFGHRRMLLCLSKNYLGDFFEKKYAIDPTTGNEIDLEINLDFSLDDIEQCYKNNLIFSEVREKAFSNIINRALRHREEQSFESEIRDSIKYAFQKSGATENECLTDEQKKKFFRLFSDRIEKYIIGINSNRDLVTHREDIEL